MLLYNQLASRVRALKNIRLAYAVFPVLLLFLFFLIFGITIPSLGYYWDDWPSIAVLKIFGAKEFFNFYASERPLQAITYLIFGPLLQINPTAWQIFTLLLRLATAFCMGWAFRLVWPRQGRLIAAAALIFAVYPAFTQQPIAVTYHVLWVQYILFFLSIGIMALSIRNPGRYWLYTGLALAAQLLNLVLSEYFYLVEFLRPLLIWMLLENRGLYAKKRVLKTLQYWSPYLLIFVLQLVGWTLYHATHPVTTYPFGEQIGKGNTPAAALAPLLHAPLQTLLQLGQRFVQDGLYLLVSIWSETVNPQSIEWTKLSNYLTWAVAGLAGAGSLFYLFHLKQEEEEDLAPARAPVVPILLIGGVTVLLGALPAWLTNHQINPLSGMFFDRFAAVPQFGASLLIAALLSAALENWKKIALVTCILVALASGSLFRSVQVYRQSWNAQRNFYWQLYWRAPGIKPGTLLLANELNTIFNVRSSTSFAINSLYSQNPGQGKMNYWLDMIHPDKSGQKPPFDQNKKLYRWAYRNLLFTADRPNSFFIYSAPSNAHCYWILGQSDHDIPGLPEKIKNTLAYTSIDRIERQPAPNDSGPVPLLGKEAAHNWCYYFQKASLARQYQDWQQIASLGDQADQAGFNIRNHTLTSAYEWMPFIEGYAREGSWERARDITLAAYQKDAAFQPMLCQLWNDLDRTSQPSDSSAKSIQAVQKAISCRQSPK